MSVESQKCLLCGGVAQSVYHSCYGFSVSSENAIVNEDIEVYVCESCTHIQKFPKESVLSQIYKNYQIDSILPYVEQVKFGNDGAKSISRRVIENCSCFLSQEMKVLDYGAGGGAMLNSLSQAYPKSSLYAYDVSSHNKHIFENLPQFVAFYDELDSINERFDCISLIHCLEHIINAKEILLRLKTLLSKNGVLVIQVPDVSQDKWDIFTYDHCHHFSPFTLRALLESCGFEVYIPQTQIDRQITIVGKKAQCKLSVPALLSHLQVLENLKSEDSALSVFGTTNRSTLIGGILGERLECFVDEDERKIGKTHLDKPIMAPQERFKNANKDVKCIIPLGDTLTQRVQDTYPCVECIGLS